MFEICFEDEPRREEWERIGLSHDREAQRQLLDESNPNKEKVTTCGRHVVRVCSFHLNDGYAKDSPAVCGEMMCFMVADCFHYQVDMFGGDGNSSSAYRFGVSNQRATSNELSLLQQCFKSFKDAF